MAPVVEIVVVASATITATAATAAARWTKGVYDMAAGNQDRSTKNKEIQRGDPEVGDPVLDRLERLEEGHDG
jgi:1,2-phenylacetyl-CoA epoxidase PaaB subunit